MTRRELEAEYGPLRPDGITIRGPGKFEGEPLYIGIFYETMMDGYGDIIDFGPEESATVFEVSEEDRREFPELEDVHAVALWTSDSGFENMEEFEDAEALEEYRAKAEKASEAAEGEEGD